MRLYVDGVLAEEDTTTGFIQQAAHVGDTAIGGFRNDTRFHDAVGGSGDGAFASGVTIDEVAVYDENELSGARVAAHAAAKLVPEPNSFAIALIALVGVCTAACRTRLLG